MFKGASNSKSVYIHHASLNSMHADFQSYAEI